MNAQQLPPEVSRPINPDLTWFTAYTGINREAAAGEALKDAGFDFYAPQTVREAIRNRRRIRVTRPLFPRYVFVGAAEADMWGKACRVRGVESLVRLAGADRPAVMPARAIELFRLAEQAGRFDKTRSQANTVIFQAGQRVRFIRGPYENIVSTIVACPSSERVQLLLSMLGAQRVATVSIFDLEAVNENGEGK